MDKKYEFLGRGVWDYFGDPLIEVTTPDGTHLAGKELWDRLAWMNAEMWVKTSNDRWRHVISIRRCDSVLKRAAHYIDSIEESSSKLVTFIDNSVEQRQKLLTFGWKTVVESFKID